jgi:signal transduction histidine kinase
MDPARDVGRHRGTGGDVVEAASGPLGGTPPHHRRPRAETSVPPHRRGNRFRLRNWRMRSKLAAVLTIPSLAFLVLAGVQTGSLVSQATELNQFAAQVGVGPEISGLVQALQQERDRTAGELAAARKAGKPDPKALGNALRPYQAGVDAAAQEFRSAAARLATNDVSWRVAYAKTVELIDQLPTLRTAATGTASPDTIFDSYSRTVDALHALLAEPSPGASHPDLSQAVLRGVQLARVKELGSQVRARLYAAARAGGYGPDDLVTLSDLRAQQLAALAEFRTSALPSQIAMYEDATVTPQFVAATRMEETTFASGGARPAVLDAERWWTVSQDRIDQVRTVEDRVLADAAAQASTRSGDQLRRTLLVAGAILLVLLVALLTSVAVGRSIARSLRTLRNHALQVAQVQLPETLERLRGVAGSVPSIDVAPPAVRSADEIGEVADAFLAVHRSAVTVAVDQAVMRRNVNAMFVNLARRSQVLVERQLELLDELEREEGDPDQLDNLFKLDHLAARMRRNDDSLLVLAGTEATRRWSDPVALPAVVLAAVAEIEQYPRVRHDAIDPVDVAGHAVSDLVHLLAELLENATAFSPPSGAVSVSGRGSARTGAVVEIVDGGLGMSENALREANDLLAMPPAADVAASERMGLFVVSHLAARHGIRVELRAASRGVIAVVRLPANLLAASHHQLPYQPSRPMLPAAAADGRGHAAAGTAGVGGTMQPRPIGPGSRRAAPAPAMMPLRQLDAPIRLDAPIGPVVPPGYATPLPAVPAGHGSSAAGHGSAEPAGYRTGAVYGSAEPAGYGSVAGYGSAEPAGYWTGARYGSAEPAGYGSVAGLGSAEAAAGYDSVPAADPSVPASARGNGGSADAGGYVGSADAGGYVGSADAGGYVGSADAGGYVGGGGATGNGGSAALGTGWASTAGPAPAAAGRAQVGWSDPGHPPTATGGWRTATGASSALPRATATPASPAARGGNGAGAASASTPAVHGDDGMGWAANSGASPANGPTGAGAASPSGGRSAAAGWAADAGSAPAAASPSAAGRPRGGWAEPAGGPEIDLPPAVRPGTGVGWAAGGRAVPDSGQAPGWAADTGAGPSQGAAPVSGVPVSGMPISGVPVPAAPGPSGHLAVPPGPGIPVAGRRPGRVAQPNRPADDAPPTSGAADSSWWSRTADNASAARSGFGAPAGGPPPAVPVTGGVSASGLPKRVPMAQLPGDAAPPVLPTQRTEADPDAVGSTLSRFYSGVRRAETEVTTDLGRLRPEQERR